MRSLKKVNLSDAIYEKYVGVKEQYSYEMKVFVIISKHIYLAQMKLIMADSLNIFLSSKCTIILRLSRFLLFFFSNREKLSEATEKHRVI